MAANTKWKNENRLLKNPLLNVKYNLALNMICGEFPSLKQIVLSRVARSIWEENDQKRMLDSSYSNEKDSSKDWWEQIIVRSLGKTALALLPKNYKNALRDLNATNFFQIWNFFDFLERLNFSMSTKRRKLYLDNICWTWQDTFDCPKTVSSLIENTDLSSIEKYALACHYCQHDHIHEMLKKLPKNFINDYVDNEDFRLMFFWTCHVLDKDEKFIKCTFREYGVINKYKYIMEWAIEEENEVAVQYIWENFPSIYLRKRLMEFIDFAYTLSCSNNILFYLITQMKQPRHFEELCVDMGYGILEKLVEDYVWRVYFMEASKYILSCIGKMNLHNSLKTVAVCWKENVVERGEYRKLLNEVALRFKVDIKVDFIFGSEAIMNLLLALEEERALRLVLGIGSINEGMSYLHNQGVQDCMYLIIHKDGCVLKTFIKEMLKTDRQIAEYQKYLLKKADEALRCRVIKRKEKEEIQIFCDTFSVED